MDAVYRPRLHTGFLRTRLFEWGLLGVLLAVVLAVGMFYARVLRTQAEFAALQFTLGRLRMALIVSHVDAAVHPKLYARRDVAPNPFNLLQTPIANYAGEAPAARLLTSPPGTWVYDRDCTCVGYLPMGLEWEHETGPSTAPAWFRVDISSGVPQLFALQTYKWNGQVLQ